VPDISIVTPVLNQVKYIEKCILSVASLGAKMEHIIIDGGSTDGTLDIIEKHKNKLAYFSSEKDNGQSDAINKGLQHCTGKLFNWLNADDTLKPNSLSTISKLLCEQTDVIIGGCRHVNLEKKTEETGTARVWNSLEKTLGNYSMGQPSVFYRTAIVKQLGGLKTELHYCMDMELWFRYLLLFGQQRIKTTNDILSTFLVHSDSKSENKKQQMRKEKYGVYHALFTETDVPEILQNFFTNYPIPRSVNLSFCNLLNYKETMAFFSWHLMQSAYEKKQISLCRAYFNIVNNGPVLSTSKRVEWLARITIAEKLKK